MKPFLLLAIAVPVLFGAEDTKSFSGSAALDAAVEQAIGKGTIPGAVLIVGRPGEILHRKAYGQRQLVPRKEKMTLDTIFDAASLTKVVATTTAVMKLLEEGKIQLTEKVTHYLPTYQGGNSDITIRQLMTHFSGLRPDLDLKPEWSGYETGIQKALIDKPTHPPGTHFTYSDINYILLGEIVHQVSGKPLDEYVKDVLIKPLKMEDSSFRPPASQYSRIAPTEVLPGTDSPIRAVVHDETCRFMGGVCGHAGLFTSADDLTRFADMLLGMGERKGVRILQPATVIKMTTPQTPHGQQILRGLGWDIDSPFSANRGELFPIGSYGHTGFTGTSIWIDPSSQTYVILMANSVHPTRHPAVTGLRRSVATIAAAAVGIKQQRVILTSYNEVNSALSPHRAVARNGAVQTGLDVLTGQKFQSLQGQRVGLITNHTGLTADGRRNIDVMLAAGVTLTALYSPEHGIAGKEDHENIGNSRDAASGLPVYSLYSGPNRRPTAETLANVDTLVFDIQDVGARFYTYTCTMLNAMEEAAKFHKRFVVLDRPNPITGVHVEGPMLDVGLESFVGCYPIPLRHGMTLGELAQLFNGEKKLGLPLEVVKMAGWQRGDWLDSTGLPWRDPSPNMRSLTAALLYPGVAMLEYSRNYSVGRGTDAPFEQVGADWIRGRELAAYLNKRDIPGVRFYPTTLHPAASNFSGKSISGIRLVVTARDQVHSERVGLELGAALQHLYPGKIDFAAGKKLIGSQAVVTALQMGEDPRTILLNEASGLQKFEAVRSRYLLY